MKPPNTNAETSESSPASQEPAPSNLREMMRRMSQGDIGSLPVILGLFLIAIIFQIANSNFLTPLNLANLMVQISAVGTISVGVVLVLLLGEIDLSVGTVSGFAAGVMAVLSVKFGLPGLVAIGAGVLTGAAIGLLQGWWTAKLKVPSFVVTLAGFLAWQGALLYILGSTGTINLTDPLIIGIANTNLPVWLGWTLGILFVSVYAFNNLREQRKREQAGLEVQPVSVAILRIVLVAVAILVTIGLMSINRNPRQGGVPIQGMPSAVLFFIGFIVLMDFVTRRTKFGRYIYSTGGNAEAARRAGINVDWIRITVFVLGSTLAACGGILAGSRLYAVNQSSGSGDILLNAIAAAVIGGTSLFGGRGSTWSALLGALVIGSIANGMNLLALASSIRFIVTGVVLLLAVTLDAYTRSRRSESGQS
ncbi:MAG: sugar ABC transporter permease [Anaerolineales bacterium]